MYRRIAFWLTVVLLASVVGLVGWFAWPTTAAQPARGSSRIPSPPHTSAATLAAPSPTTSATSASPTPSSSDQEFTDPTAFEAVAVYVVRVDMPAATTDIYTIVVGSPASGAQYRTYLGSTQGKCVANSDTVIPFTVTSTAAEAGLSLYPIAPGVSGSDTRGVLNVDHGYTTDCGPRYALGSSVKSPTDADASFVLAAGGHSAQNAFAFRGAAKPLFFRVEVATGTINSISTTPAGSDLVGYDRVAMVFYIAAGAKCTKLDSRLQCM